jgi:hypothetical protein
MPKSRDPSRYPGEKYLAIAQHVVSTNTPVVAEIPSKQAYQLQQDFNSYVRAIQFNNQEELYLVLSKIVCRLKHLGTGMSTVSFELRAQSYSLDSFLSQIGEASSEPSISRTTDFLDSILNPKNPR